MIVLHRKINKEICEIGLKVRFGAVHEKSAGVPIGTAHFMEHMAFRGEESKRIVKEMVRYGADVNAYTTASTTTFYTSCLKKDFDHVLRLFMQFIMNMQHFSMDDFEKEKEVILQECNMSQNEDYYGYSMGLFKAMGLDNETIEERIGVSEILGTPDSIKSITPEHLTIALSNYNDSILYTASNEKRAPDLRPFLAMLEPKFCIFSTKDFTAKDFDMTKNGGVLYFSGDANTVMPLQHNKTALFNKELSVTEGTYYTLPSNNTLAALTYAVEHETDRERLVNHMVNQYLAGTMHSPLPEEIRENKGMCYSLFASRVFIEEDRTLNMIYAVTTCEPMSVVSAMRSVLDNITYIDLDLLEAVKNQELLVIEKYLESADSYVRSKYTTELSFEFIKDNINSISVEDMIHTINHIRETCKHIILKNATYALAA